MPETGSRQDPFPAFRFKVDIGGLVGGFSECGGLTMETEVFEYPEGGTNDYVHKLPTRFKQGNLTLKRGVVDGKFWQWYAKTLPGKEKPRNGSIQQLDERGTVVMTWRIDRAYPRKVEGPSFNAGQSGVSVESMELCHHGLRLS